MNNTTRVVIVGAGFGGLAAARSLAKRGAAVQLIDRHNHHLFQPLLYQVATAGLAARRDLDGRSVRCCAATREST
jgi:NADH:ubiquinone reductase (H+-translocating)